MAKNEFYTYIVAPILVVAAGALVIKGYTHDRFDNAAIHQMIGMGQGEPLDTSIFSTSRASDPHLAIEKGMDAGLLVTRDFMPAAYGSIACITLAMNGGDPSQEAAAFVESAYLPKSAQRREGQQSAGEACEHELAALPKPPEGYTYPDGLKDAVPYVPFW